MAAAMNITSQTTIMQNQKVASSMPADAHFQVVEADNGDSLFFSIGSDGVLRVTRELQENETGWDRLDLTSSIDLNTKVLAQTFAIYQNTVTRNFDIAVAVNINNAQSLYIVREYSAAHDLANNPIKWTSIPFDADGTAPSPLVIQNLYLMNLPSPINPKTSVEFCFVDIAYQNSFQRYYINFDQAPHWNLHLANVQVEIKTIMSCPGRKMPTASLPMAYPGLYTFGLQADKPQLVFAPQQNEKDTKAPPLVTRLKVSPKARAIASAANLQGYTNLFVVGADGLVVFSPDNQKDGSTGVNVISADAITGQNPFEGVTSMAATSAGGFTFVWFLNDQNVLVTARCPIGSESKPGSWLGPFPFAANIDHFAFFANSSTQDPGLSLFTRSKTLPTLKNGQISNPQMIQHKQDLTATWTNRPIRVGATDDTYDAFNAFTTNIKVVDGDSVPQASIAVKIGSSEPVSVLINNVAYNIDANTTATVATDAMGCITVIQQTNAIAGVAITATLATNSAVTHVVDPHEVSTSKLDSLSREDLDSVKIIDAQGNSRNLVPDHVPAGSKDDFMSALASLKSNPNFSSARNRSQTVATAAPQGSIISFLNTCVSDVVQAAEAIEHYVEHKISAISSYVKEGIHWFEVNIAGVLYKAVVNTARDVFHAVQLCFKSLEVAFEDIIAWVGSLFNWKNIVRTHTVIKSEIRGLMKTTSDALNTLSSQAHSSLENLKGKLKAWEDPKDKSPPPTMGTLQQKDQGTASHYDSAQTNWARYHAQNGLAKKDLKSVEEQGIGHQQTDTPLEDLMSWLSQQTSSIIGGVKGIPESIDANGVRQKGPLDVVKMVLAKIADLIVGIVETAVDKLLSLLGQVLDEIMKLLDTELDIPVISGIYEQFTGEKLSVLDLACFMAAIPATVIYGLITIDPQHPGDPPKAPFPDDNSVTMATTAGDVRRARQLAILKGDKLASAEMDRGGIEATDALTILFDIVAWPGIAITSFTGAYESPSQLVRMVTLAGTVLAALPGFQIWTVSSDIDQFGIAVGLVAVGKAVVDAKYGGASGWTAVSPTLDTIINFVSLGPILGSWAIADSHTAYNNAIFAANMIYATAGILSIAEEAKPFQIFLNLLYGTLNLVCSIEYYESHK